MKYEEVTAVDENQSIRKCDIMVIVKIKSKGVIFDSTKRFEISSKQPVNVNK